MIFQNLVVAAAAGFTLIVATSPKRADFYPYSPAWSGTGAGGIIDTPGSPYTAVLHDSTKSAFYRANAAGSLIGYEYVAKTGIYSGYSFTDIAGIADYSVPMKAPPTLFTGMQTALNAGIVRIHQGLKRTSFAAWSEVQRLTPPEHFSYPTEFAQAVVADQGSDSLLAVGCPGCNATSNGGQVYLYSPHVGGAYAWSQSQVLQLSSSATHAGYHRLGRDVEVYDNVLLASVYVPNSIPKNGYVVFSRGPGPKDPFEPKQILTATRGNATAASVYEETIILADAQATYGGNSRVGEVYILYPSTPEFGSKPSAKPHPAQWSVQQVLRPATKSDDLLFGSSISIERNLLMVSSLGDDDHNVLFRREERSGMWSQQQVLAGGENVDLVKVAGGAISLGATTLGASPLPVLFSNQANWDCLILSLEDHFGDGWDTAELIVATPDGKHEYFAPGCDVANPLKLRYCPTRSVEGIYSFSIPEAAKAKHYWEIQYSVFDENTAIWYRGKWDTKMDFHWDPDTLTFSPRKIERALANSTVCEYCPSRPTDKPTPLLHRNLKGGKSGDDVSHTRSPTISPAPTLATTNILNWRYLTLYGDTKPWFDNQYQGSNYYVTDAHGHRLIGTGTACTQGIDTQCWLDLPDGDYILRLGGALDPNKGSHKFTFCKTINEKGMRSQMMFRIKDDDCSIVTFASRSAVCRSIGYSSIAASMYLVLNVNLLLHGTSLSSTSSAEHHVFEAAMSSLFPGMATTDVTLVSVTSAGSNTIVNANLRMSSDAMGYNFLDYEQEEAFEAYLKTAFSSRDMEANLVVGLASGSVATAFAQVTRAEFLDYRLVDSIEVLDTSEIADMVTSYADIPTSDLVDYANPSSSDAASSADASATLVLNSLSFAGYFLAFVGILFVVAFFRKGSSSETSPGAAAAADCHSDSSTDVMESASDSGSLSESFKPIKTRSRSISNSSSSKNKNLSAKELHELAEMEQEYLKLATTDAAAL
jgi:hypothetical protein